MVWTIKQATPSRVSEWGVYCGLINFEIGLFAKQKYVISDNISLCDKIPLRFHWKNNKQWHATYTGMTTVLAGSSIRTATYRVTRDLHDVSHVHCVHVMYIIMVRKLKSITTNKLVINHKIVCVSYCCQALYWHEVQDECRISIFSRHVVKKFHWNYYHYRFPNPLGT